MGIVCVYLRPRGRVAVWCRWGEIGGSDRTGAMTNAVPTVENLLIGTTLGPLARPKCDHAASC